MKDSTKTACFPTTSSLPAGSREFHSLSLWERSTCLHGRDCFLGRPTVARPPSIRARHPLQKLVNPGHVPDGHLPGGCRLRDRPRPPSLHPPKNGFSRMGLQTPNSDSSWNWIWKTGRLDLGRLEDWPSAGLYTQLCLQHGGG